MKIVLTETELQDALRHAYPVPDGYRMAGVTIQKYSADFCTLELARNEPAPIAAVLPLAGDVADDANDAVAA